MQKTITKLLIFGVVLLGLIIGGYYYYQNTFTINNNSDSINHESVVNNISDENSILQIITDSENKLSANLQDVSGGDSSGTAYLLRSNGTLYHYVKAKLPKLDSGLSYEGWLVNKTPSLKFFSTGVLEQSDDIFTLEYTSKDEYPNYNFVVITLETVIDDIPEKHIIEGTVE